MPEYVIILWFCATSAPNCAMYDSAYHKAMIFPAKTRYRCEEMWKEYMSVNDPPGFVSNHECQPVKEPL